MRMRCFCAALARGVSFESRRQLVQHRSPGYPGFDVQLKLTPSSRRQCRFRLPFMASSGDERLRRHPRLEVWL